jgi:hypothetical protein
VYSDLGNSLFVHNLEPLSVENLPYNFEHTFTFNSILTGNYLRFKLLARNQIGSTLSANYLRVLLAGIPPSPLTTVVKIFSDKQRIVVEMPVAQDNGGSTL